MFQAVGVALVVRLPEGVEQVFQIGHTLPALAGGVVKHERAAPDFAPPSREYRHGLLLEIFRLRFVLLRVVKAVGHIVDVLLVEVASHGRQGFDKQEGITGLVDSL